MHYERLIRHYFEDVWNKADHPLADSIFAAPHVLHDPTHMWVARGAEGMKRLVSTYQTAFPDVQTRVDQLLRAGHYVTTRWTFTGTHAGPFFHFAPTGKRVEVPVMQIDRFENDMCAETWSLWDTLGLYIQMGVAPRALHEDTEEAQLSYMETHKRWWQIDEKGTDEPHGREADQ